MSDVASDLTDSDDLDIVNNVRRDLGADKYIAKVIDSGTETQSATDGDNVATQKPRMRDTDARGQRVEWSADSRITISEDEYAKFKDRKAVKRKRAAASSRKAKAVVKGDGNSNTSAKAKKTNGSSKVKTSGSKTNDWGDDSDDDLGMEHTLPDFLQSRRSKFEKRRETMKEAGLKLPPLYGDIDLSDDERLENLEERPDFPGAKQWHPYKDIQLPKSLGLIPAPLARYLRDYQVDGTAFLHQLFVYQTGGILGDDMGLGKTVQVIAFLTAAFGKTGDERDSKRMRKKRRAGASWYPRVLIACPGTLIENWKDELKRWGWWHVDVFHGSTREGALESAKSGRVEIMITTYTTYRMNKDAINAIEWDCVIADECHQIKGRSSETTKAMNEINALCRIGLTGTAIQNSYDELWALLNWTNPGKFGPVSVWKETISRPLRDGQSHDATVFQLSKARKTAEKLRDNLLPRFFLRRLKSLIADQLPQKSDRVVFCPLTDTQSDAYENFVDGDVIRYIRDSTVSCTCGSDKKQGFCCYQFLPDGSKWQSHVFPSIANLQKLANHLAILIPQSSDLKEKQDKDLESLQVALPDQWRELFRSRDSILNFSNPEFCGKWKILKKLLKFWHGNGDKVLVFSHSVRLLKMLQMLFTHTSYIVAYLDGSMSLPDRAKAVDDFNSDSSQFVFLISTKAGGVGLNITSANKVVVVDPNWNPSYDLQAQDRAYRIGQSRNVEVFRLVSAGTIEEIVYARQIYKQQQANIAYTASTERRYFKGIQDNKDQKGEIFGLANLFAYQGDNMVLRDIVNKTNVAESRAGVHVVGLELSQDKDDEDPLGNTSDDDEEGAMSQLASIIIDEADEAAGKAGRSKKRKKKVSTGKSKGIDPVQAILSGAGVEYTHENSEVVGSSRIEAKLSRRAQEAGNDIDMGGQHVFANTQDRAVSAPKTRPADDSDFEEIDGDLDGKDSGDVEWRYHPPQEVMKRQLCTMAETFGYDDVVEFACMVEGWTQAQRRDCLDKFYKGRRETLGLA